MLGFLKTIGGPRLDPAYQLAYKAAYRLMRVYWTVSKANTHGALVALWHQDRILLVKNSYVPYHSLPGGYVHPGEAALAAALRELKEEMNLGLAPGQLRHAWEERHHWEGKTDHVEIFEVELDHEPTFQVDNREVVSAGFYPATQALKMNIFPIIRNHILDRQKRQNAPK